MPFDIYYRLGNMAQNNDSNVENVLELYQNSKGTNHMNIQWKDHIVSTPDVIRGKPRIKGTRIPVSLILGYLAANRTHQDIITEYPDLKKAHISTCLDYARELAEFEVAA